ncbi:hypothetical protein [uncultured Endozoicomonas sp.]|uniref:hypothetical protein n=1 Tax=uncultured Endozoicomonas sp. TaxID=432652 RepID=UPI00261850C0|nr:hypothetical protein [uncultured Endozoicomonas sp.]
MSFSIGFNPLSFFSGFSVVDNGAQGARSGRMVGKGDIKNFFCPKEQLTVNTTSLYERCVYPLNAIKKRILNFAVLGATVTGILAMSVPAFLGAIVGGAIGGAVKLAKMMMGQDSNATDLGLVIGGMTGAFLGAVTSAPMVLFAVTAFSVLGLVKSAVKLPMDVYYASTLSDEGLDDYFNEEIDEVEALLTEPIWTEYEALKQAISESKERAGWFKALAKRYGVYDEPD